MNVQVVDYDPAWPAEFRAEADRIRSALGECCVAVHHIGSTAIPGISAKPILDLLLEVDDLLQLDARTPALTAIGYEAKGEFGIPGRRYFRKDSPTGIRTHQIHSFEVGSAGSDRHLAFRDYMRAHPAVAQSYGVLKLRLAACHPDDIEAYMDGKDGFVQEHEAKALLWKKTAQTFDPSDSTVLDSQPTFQDAGQQEQKPARPR